MPQLTAVRGRVIAVEERRYPRTTGGGLVLNGWGGVGVNTHLEPENLFWLQRADTGTDQRFDLNQNPMPPMLPGHAITVGLWGDIICSVTNHSTGGDQCWYRPVQPDGPYQRLPECGCGMVFLFACFALFTCMVAAFLARTSPVVALVPLSISFTIAVLCYVSSSSYRRKILSHNERIDLELANLIHLPTPINRGKIS
jgi:hypothetical protein